MTIENGPTIGRRSLLAAGAGFALAPLLAGGAASPAAAQAAGPVDTATPQVSDRRRLGELEVSSLGLGVQNMHRTYQTTIPHRPEMLAIIRTAFDRGVTFFDCAEAYGPFENERILGEAIAPFRNEVVITSKFGWNID
jgi:hypothetical protein